MKSVLCHSRDVRRSSEVRLVLFDLDGTLADSGPSFVNSLRHGLEGIGADVPDDDVMRSFIGPPLIETFRDHFGFDEATSAEALRLYRERWGELGVGETYAYPGVPEVVAQLAASELTLAIATSKPTASAVRVVEYLGLADYFSFIGGAEFEGKRQRKGEVIAHTLEELAALGRERVQPSEVRMIGDRRHDVVGAREHDIDCIGVLWGFGSRDELVDAGAVAIAEAPSDLLTLLPTAPAAPGWR